MFTRIAFLLLTILAGSVTAQDNRFVVYCGDQLAEADCALLENAYDKLFDLRSGSFEAQLRYWYENPGDPGDGAGFTYSAQGVFTDLDASGFIPSGGNPPDSRRVFGSFQADLMAEFTQREPARSQNDPPHLLTSAANLRVLDGYVYIDFASLEEPLGPEYTGWGSYPLDLTPRPVATPSDPNVITQRLVLGLDAGQLIDEFEPDLVRQYLVVTRADDEAGQAVFETAIDIPGLYADQIFRELLRDWLTQYRERAVATPSGLREPPTDAELDRIGQQMSLLFPEPLHLHSQFVDLDTGIFSGLYQWYIDTNIDMIDAISTRSEINEWVRSRGEILLRIADFNQPYEVSAPEAATPLDYETILQIPTLLFIPVENRNQGGS